MNGLRMVQKGDAPKEGITSVQAAADTVVLDENFEEVEPGSETVGRIARGGNIPLGYYNDPVKTAETFVTDPQGRRWSIPGDFARIEADGRITLLGRGSVMINSGGEKIYPEEVEGALKSHPDVYDVLVVGVPDERWGERVTAVLQPRPGRTVELVDLQDHCRSQIAGYKVPRELFLVDAVPRHVNGKPDYRSAKAEAVSRASGT
jgi:fatty-acyl-CoA synthase